MDKKSINKIIVGAILGSAVMGLGKFSKSKKGKSFFHSVSSKLGNAAKDFRVAIGDLKRSLFGKGKSKR